MPSLENWGGRLKSLLWAQLSLHIQSPNLSTTNTEHREYIKFTMLLRNLLPDPKVRKTDNETEWYSSYFIGLELPITIV